MSDDDIRHALTEYRTWAVVGCSPSPLRDSHRIASLLKARGYRVIPVNPKCDEVFAYFNNDWEGFAVRNALRLRALVEQ